MSKEESLSFLQSCIDKVNCATEQNMNRLKKYELDVAIQSGLPFIDFTKNES